jgi:hypothetical protein
VSAPKFGRFFETRMVMTSRSAPFLRLRIGFFGGHTAVNPVSCGLPSTEAVWAEAVGDPLHPAARYSGAINVGSEGGEGLSLGLVMLGNGPPRLDQGCKALTSLTKG